MHRSTFLLVAILAGLVACSGKQPKVDASEQTVIDEKTGTFAIPNTPYRRGVEVYEHVTVLPAEVMAEAEAETATDEGEALTFPRDLGPVEGLKEGDVVLSRHDGGFARKIRGIERTEESVTLEMTGVHLNEVVASGEFYFGPTRRVEFANGESYVPPETYEGADWAASSETWSERQQRFKSPARAPQQPETLFRLGPRTPGTQNLVANTGNLTPHLNAKLEEFGLGSQLEFVHQMTDLGMAASVRMRFCRGEECDGEAPVGGLARLERFELREHGWIDTNTRLRYRAASLVVPDADADGRPDWRQEGLEDFRELQVLSTDSEGESIFEFPKTGDNTPVRREFEIVPGVKLRFEYDVAVGLQVLGERPMDVETGFEFTAQGGAREHSADAPSAWTSPSGGGGTCGRTSAHEWHTRPVFAAKKPTGDTLRLRVRVKPEVNVEFTGGVEGGARAVPFGGEHRFDQHVSAPQVGNCATVAETTGYGVEERRLREMILKADDGALGLDIESGHDGAFERRLDFATDQVAVPGICNPAWTPTVGAAMSEREKKCGGSRRLGALSSESCPMLRVEEARYCHDRENNPVDFDDDGVPRGSDGCPCIFNPVQIDSDGHGESNPCDSDADQDGVSDTTDNCPTIVNPNQKEGPVEGVGAACTAEQKLFCASPPIRVQPMPSESKSEKVSCRFRLSHLAKGTDGGELRGYLHIDNALGTQPPVVESERSRVFYEENVAFRDFDGPASGGADASFLSGRELGFERRDGGSAVVELPEKACEAYRRAVSDWEPKGYEVTFRLAGACIPGDAKYRERMLYCPHSREKVDVGQDGDDWPDPPTPNPLQNYDPRSDGSILRAAGGEFEPTSYDVSLKQWDRCPFHENPVAKGDESAENGPNDGAACRVKLDQGAAFGDEAISAIDHPSPVFELEFPEGVSREDWKGDFPLVDYAGDGVLDHHPGYPQPCRASDIRRCEEDDGCEVPRCSDNCPTIPNPHQQDRNDNGVGDRCEHADSEPVDREADRGRRFGVNNPHFIDSTGKLKIYDSDQDDVPDHLDNCPWDWNASQTNTNGPGAGRPPGLKTYETWKGEQRTPGGYDNWHTDRRGNACDPDRDGDGFGNVCDGDADGDRVPSVLDFCPKLALRVQNEEKGPVDKRTNRPCADSDEDGIQGQPKDYPPIGEDEVAEAWYRKGWAGFAELERPTFTTVDGAEFAVGADNCPTVANPGQFDLDHDGVGDACDPDLDEDGTTNEADTCPQSSKESGSEQ